MNSRPPHAPDDARGPGDAGTPELAPVIATIEELVAGIARELSASLAPPSLPAQVATGTPVASSSLAHDLDAAGARIRELREQLWYAQAATHTATDSAPHAADRQGTQLARFRDLEPLFMRLESQIRLARQGMRLSEKSEDQKPEDIEPSPMKSPWLPADAASPRLTKPGDVRSVNDVVPSVEASEPRRRWLWPAAAAMLLIATAIGSWLATRDVRQEAPSAVTSADRPTAVTNPPSPAAPSPPTAADEPAEPSVQAAVDQPTESSPVATATSGSFPARPQSDAESDSPVPRAVEVANARASARAGGRADDPVATNTSDPSARQAVSTAAGVEPNRPSAPTESRPAVEAAAVTSQSPLVAPRQDAGTAPGITSPGTTVTQPSGAERIPPADVIARSAATPPSLEDITRTAPPAETTRADATEGAVPTAEARPLNRPAAVVTRVQPRMMVEMISADMAAGVELRVRVDRTGRATDVRAVSGPVALRTPAEDTVRRWTFSPALQDGEPVDGELLVTLTFGATPRNLRLPRRSP